MTEANLSRRIKDQLPVGLIAFMQAAGQAAQKGKHSLYLVGGVVRDLLLERRNFDLDLVLEGDAISLARELALFKEAEVITHTRFGTARLRWDDFSADLATARTETYAKPGALPAVKPGTINDDLSRRDFSINSMAVNLTPGHFGELLDPFQGRDDIERGLVRVLHEKSFIDDATRIWRALRYEQRLDFKLEPVTLRLLRSDLAMLGTVSGDRIRHELECVLKEEQPEKALRRAGELGVLARLHPSLKGDEWLPEKFARARQVVHDEPSTPLYLALLAYRLNGGEMEQLISYLKLPKDSALVLRDTTAVKEKIEVLSDSRLAPSYIYSLLHGYNPAALTACSIAADSAIAAEHIELYLNALRYVKSTLSGENLKKMGFEGPRIKEILQMLREARLDGKVESRKEEEEMVRARFPF